MTEYFRKDAESVPVPQETSFPSASEHISSVPCRILTSGRSSCRLPPIRFRQTFQRANRLAPVSPPRALGNKTGSRYLLPNKADEFRSRWDSIQVGFVDQPRKAVEDADALVAAASEPARRDFLCREAEARTPVGKKRKHLNRGSSYHTTKISLVFRPAALDISLRTYLAHLVRSGHS